MKTMLRKSVTLLAAFLVPVGGFLAFESFTAERGKAQEGTRTIYVYQRGPYVANLCIKNETKLNHEVCTGNVPVGSVRDLTFPWNPGDDISFIAAVVAGHNGYYEPIADRDQVCWSDGTSLAVGAYCRPADQTDW